MSSFARVAASFGVLSLIVLGLAKTTPAFACSCLPVESAQAGMDMSDAVFQGTVTDVNQGQMNNEVTFSVNSSWKGNGSEELTLTTARDSAACGIDFQVGQEYLVYADQGEDGLTAGLCSRTALASDAASDIAEFNRLDSGNGGPAIEDEDEAMEISSGIVLTAGLSFLLGVAVTYLLTSRSSKKR